MRGRDDIAALFRRPTTSAGYIPEVDGLRCFAILAVVLHHITAAFVETSGRFGDVSLPAQWWQVFPQAAVVEVGYAGHFGVHLFFVISGFVLALPFVAHYRDGGARPRTASFYLRRLIRLELPYMLSVLVAFAVVYGTNPGWSAFVPHLLPTLLYLHGPLFGQASWIHGIAWSLEVEVQFYLVMPLLAYLLAPRSAPVRRGLLLLLMVGWAFAAQTWLDRAVYPRLHLSLANQLPFFLAGFLWADLRHDFDRVPVRNGRAWDFVAMAAAATLYAILTRKYGLYWLTPCLVLALYVALGRGTWSRAVLRYRWSVAIGGMSYSIYLYHALLLRPLAPTTMAWSAESLPITLAWLVRVAVLLPPILVVSALAYLAVERPCLGWSRRFSRR